MFCFLKKSCYTPFKGGYVTLISVLVVGAVGISIAVSLLTLGIDSARTSSVFEKSLQAKGLVQACVEEALQQIRDSTTFTGSGNMSLGQGTCSYAVTSQGAQNRTVTAIGVVGSVTRKAKIILNGINPLITLVSWQEIADL